MLLLCNKLTAVLHVYPLILVRYLFTNTAFVILMSNQMKVMTLCVTTG